METTVAAPVSSASFANPGVGRRRRAAAELPNQLLLRSMADELLLLIMEAAIHPALQSPELERGVNGSRLKVENSFCIRLADGRCVHSVLTWLVLEDRLAAVGIGLLESESFESFRSAEAGVTSN